MTSRDFCFWLQGFFEVSGFTDITAAQTEKIKAHLALVFKHEIDPSIDKGDPKTKLQLDAIHGSDPLGPTHFRC